MSDRMLDRLGRLFQFGSLDKTIYCSPDIVAEVNALIVDAPQFYRRGAAVVPAHWAYPESQAQNVLMAWDHDMDRPDFA